MNLNNFTIKSQEAVQKAVELVTLNGQQTIEVAHILKGILLVDENVTPFILKKLNVNMNSFTLALDKIVEGYPKLSTGKHDQLVNGTFIHHYDLDFFKLQFLHFLCLLKQEQHYYIWFIITNFKHVKAYILKLAELILTSTAKRC